MAGAVMSSEEVEALPWTEVGSSNVARVAWVPTPGAVPVAARERLPQVGSLYVEFHGGSDYRVYRYADVREEHHTELLEADSVGGYLNAEIKNETHECERIEVVPGPAAPPRLAAHRPVG